MMISTNTNDAMIIEVLAFDLPASPTLCSVFVEVRRCGDKAIVIEQPRYNSK